MKAGLKKSGQHTLSLGRCLGDDMLFLVYGFLNVSGRVLCLLQRLRSLPSRMGCISKDRNVMGDVVQASLSDESSLECWSMFLQCMFSFLVKGGMSLQTPVL